MRFINDRLLNQSLTYMLRWKNIIFNSLLCLNILLLFFVIMTNKLIVPAWLQVIGRMHPLLLHFPIVLLVLYILWSVIIISKKMIDPLLIEIGDWLLLIGALSAVTTALMGIFLSREPGYNSEALLYHQWSGLSISFLSFGLYAFKKQVLNFKYLSPVIGAGFLVLIIFTGHQGAGITHGNDFLMAPINTIKIKPVVAIEDAFVYADMVQPILEAKCISCHNSKKAKGQLMMETEAQLLKGGKHGALWQNDEFLLGLLLQRIHLGEEDKNHMPPIGKPQLEEAEKQILFHWIKAGANFKLKVNSLAPNDSLGILAAKSFTNTSEVTYEFKPADDKILAQLNNTNRLVHPIAKNSSALAVNFYNRQNYNSALLKDLLPLKEQIISIDLAYMPLKEEDINTLANFKNIRKLNLNFTSLQGNSLILLNQLTNLNHLSISGNQLSNKDVQILSSFKKLRTVYMWESPLSAEEITALRKRNPTIKIEMGYTNDTIMLKLTPPILENEQRVITSAMALHLKHYIKGVEIRYTIDGTEPDSIKSLLYNTNTTIENYTKIKARAYKKGWLKSDSLVAIFYKNTFKADSIRSLLPLDSVYKGNGAKTLINGELGEMDLKSGKWLGFRSHPMEMLLAYNKEVKISSITLSTLVDINSFLMPPLYIEIWGGIDKNKLIKLGKITPEQPTKTVSAYQTGYDCKFAARTVNFIKVLAVPISKLPIWHSARGQKGWVFIDEIFVN